MKATTKTLLVIGGGAAGIFCAVNAAAACPGLQVLVAEKTSKLLAKVKISGGGRCNVTHNCDGNAALLKHYPRGNSFLKKAFHQFSTTDTIAWFANRGVVLKTEADGRMFPETNSSQTIIDCILQEANRHNVNFLYQHEVAELKRQNNQYQISFKNGSSLVVDFVVVASGGYPKMLQFDWLLKTGHTVQPPVPSLFTFNMPGNAITALMGVVADKAIIKIAGTKLQQQGPVLITHWGISGPAVLKLSAWAARELAEANYQFKVMINWLPAYHELSLREKMQEFRFAIATQKIGNRNPFALPQRLWHYLLEQSAISADARWADMPAKNQNMLAKICCAQEMTVAGKTTFKEEFVTAGGISLQEIDANTLQSKLHPHLFFAGEVLDIDGVTGGFNFQNAWTTGWIAAQAIAKLAMHE
jgi:predicted Rossmann fold flavoprotein